jgi:hypothetical protein
VKLGAGPSQQFVPSICPNEVSDVGELVKQSSSTKKSLTSPGSKFDWEWVWRVANTPRIIVVLNRLDVTSSGQLLE